MSVKDIYNKKIQINSENCQNLKKLNQEMREISKMVSKKEIRHIEYSIKIEYR